MTSATALIVMGVSGSGKTTVGRELARRLGWAFEEGDALHTRSEIEKMHAGHPLDDVDRAPWLAAIARWIDAQLEARMPGVITCSALKRSYRDQLREGRPGVRLLYLRATEPVIAARVAARRGHFMPPSLLHSQFETLEPPDAAEGVMIVDVDRQSPEEAVAVALDLLRA